MMHVTNLGTPTPVRHAGKTVSEGGFAPDRVSAASLLDVEEATDKKGKKYYKYELLVRSGETRRGRARCLVVSSEVQYVWSLHPCEVAGQLVHLFQLALGCSSTTSMSCLYAWVRQALRRLGFRLCDVMCGLQPHLGT
eukprot:GHUV01028736.1.p1 GENE.GHUV01028736.1~~GHUV01028736.1.p1  ORF type:complete len:138 (-),score=26.00 GHUV01028736.1:1123-1536(-)